MENTFLEGETLILRPLVLSDLEGSYMSWLNDEEVSAHNSHHVFPYTSAQAKAYIDSVNGDSGNLVLAIVAKDNKKHIGNISLQKINQISRNAEFAVLIGDKDYWGKGVASEAGKLIIEHGFGALNLHRIYCGTSASNIAMQKLAEKLGFQAEGRRKEAVFKKGQYEDVIEYGLVRAS